MNMNRLLRIHILHHHLLLMLMTAIRVRVLMMVCSASTPAMTWMMRTLTTIFSRTPVRTMLGEKVLL